MTGPESTGKSVLSEALAKHFDTAWVPEYARAYLDDIRRDYIFEDIVDIARGQYKREQELFLQGGQFIFCDTDFLVCKIWSEEKFGKCDPWIDKMYSKNIYDLYLLCKPDIPWVADPLRENPGDRNRLYDIYLNQLKEKDYHYKIASGSGKERLEMAIEHCKMLSI